METLSLSSANNTAAQPMEQKAGILNLLQCKCPRCRKGNMFENNNPWHLKSTMKMHSECAVCGQPFNLEVGFYYGSGYVSYALSVALSVATFIAWWVFVGISINDNRVLYWLPVNGAFLLAMQPYLMRLARTGWLAFFVPYNKNWKTVPPKPVERVNKGQENNW